MEEVEEGVLEDGAEFEEVQVALAELVDGVEASAGGFMLSGSLVNFWHRCVTPIFLHSNSKRSSGNAWSGSRTSSRFDDFILN